MKTSKNASISLVISATAILLVVVPFAPAASQSNEIWQNVEERFLDTTAKRVIVPEIYRAVRLDRAALAQTLAKAPMEYSLEARQHPAIIHLPMPDGTMARFRFEESPVIEPGLAAKYPELKMTYRAKGVDDPAATSRFNWLPSGFHAIILSPSGTVLIDPYAPGNTTDYVSYFSKDLPNSVKAFQCGVKDSDLPPLPERAAGGLAPAVSSGTTLRTYRLALACTHEFAVGAHEGRPPDTIASALAAEVAIMDRVNALYESEVSIHLNLIANNDLITYASEQTCNGEPCTDDNDPYTNANLGAMLGENANNLASVIGVANFDIGHVFARYGGGLAFLSTVCNEFGKAYGVSGPGNPLDDAGALSLVAHEIGHQFGAGHTYNGITNGCSPGQRFPDSAYEPGSGATMMSYLFACGVENLAPPFLYMFHVKSLETIIAFSQTGAGNSCPVQTSTGQTPPAITGPGNFNIPKKTPFSLTASLTGPAHDLVTYDWEEYDLGPPPPSSSPVPNSDADGQARPIFRGYAPTVGGTRTFPSLIYILNNANVPPATITVDGNQYMTGEILPSITRAMTFQVVVRRNQVIGGGISTATSVVNVVGPAGPFAVTAPNTAISVPALGYCTVRWNVTGTTLAPIHAEKVKISLSTNGGETFPTVLADSTTNDGVESVLIPNVATTATARIKVEAFGNIFFDISDTNFTITPVGTRPGPTPNPSPTPTPSPILAGTLSLPFTSINQSVTDFTFPVVTTELDAVVNLIGFQGDLLFDSSVITFQSTPVSKTGLTGGNWNVTGSVLPGPGPIRTLRILATSTDSTPLSGSGNLFNLNMTRVSSTPDDFSQLTWAAPPNNFHFVDTGSNSYTLEFTPPGFIQIGGAGVIDPDL